MLGHVQQVYTKYECGWSYRFRKTKFLIKDYENFPPITRRS